jgi:hypothetical protein
MVKLELHLNFSGFNLVTVLEKIGWLALLRWGDKSKAILTNVSPKIMNTSSLKWITAAGISLLSCATLQAAIDSIVDVDLKCYYQSSFTSNQDRVTGKVSVLRLSGKQLVTLLAKKSGIKYTNGSRLKSVGGLIYVADAKGKPLGDVSKYFKLKISNTATLFNGSRDLASGKEKTRSYESVTFTLNLPGLEGTINGVLLDDLTIAAPNKFGVQYSTGVGSANVNGTGFFDTKTAYFDGGLSLLGREAYVNP